MQKIKNIVSINKTWFNFQLKTGVFFHYFKELIQKKMSIKSFFFLMKRLNYFVSQLQENKFVKIGKNTRLNLYIPDFPTPSFYTACNKFKEFEQKLPCTTALISITSACKYNCQHCYQKYDIGKDGDINKTIEVVKKLQDMGIAFFNIEGGEPFLVFDKLEKICTAINNRSEIWINSSGDGMSSDKLAVLKKLGVKAVMFSLHSSNPDELNKFMGSESAWKNLSKGIELCHQANIVVAFNICLGKKDFYNGEFEKIMETAKVFKAAIIQLINPKPAGGWLKSGADIFSKEDLAHVKTLVNKYNHSPKYRQYPAISAQINEEDKNMFGCTAGGTDRFYINAKGDVQPCEFLNISFGNINDEDFSIIYKRMRNIFKNPGEDWLCQKYSKDIYQIYFENNLKALPLNKELSEQIYLNWDRGNPTELYDKIENELA